jgi:hypothetical protein
MGEHPNKENSEIPESMSVGKMNMQAKTSTGFLLLGLLLTGVAISAAQDKAVLGSAPQGASILFIKDMKQGEYERFKLSLEESGRGNFEAKPREGQLVSRNLEVSTETMQQLFSLFESAQFLSSNRDYESHFKVADMGMKTIVLQKKGRSREVRFNYTTDRNINTIADQLNGIVTTELRADSLEKSMKYDKLGLPDQITALQNELNGHWLAEPQLLLPVLRQIANNPAYFNMVQRKAHQLILLIESQKAAPSK